MRGGGKGGRAENENQSADQSGCREFPNMISSQDGTDARRDRPPAAFLTGRSRAGAGSPAAAAGATPAARRSVSGARGGSACGPGGGGAGAAAVNGAGEGG